MSSINTVSPSIRDYLLSRNLAFADTIVNNGYVPNASGIGLPIQFNNNPNVIPSLDLEVEGTFYRDLNIINNEFNSTNTLERVEINFNNSNVGNIGEYTSNIASQSNSSEFTVSSNNSRLQLNNNQYLPNNIQSYLVNIQNNNTIFNNQRVGGYLDNNGRIRGTTNTNTIDSISGFLTGATDFDIRSSLASRVLSGAGFIDDTELGIIGNRELIKAMKAKALFNTRREVLGQVNLNPLSLIMGNDFIREDYSITVPSSSFGRVLDVGLNILGFESPISYMDTEASIFNYELNGNVAYTNNWFDRNTARIKNTGRGQLTELFKNLNANLNPKFSNGGMRYTPGYEDERIKTSGVEQNLYINYDVDTRNLSNFDGDLNYIGKFSKNVIYNIPFSWNTKSNSINVKSDLDSGDLLDIRQNQTDSDNVNTRKGGVGMLGSNLQSGVEGIRFDDKKTILGKTQELFDKGIIKTLLSNKGMRSSGSILENTEDKGGSYPMISKGSAVKYLNISQGGTSDNPNDVFCRSWVNYRSYNQVGRLQKHSTINPRGGIRLQNYTKSVLDDNGFVKFAPYSEDIDKPLNEVRKYMFSLENLAWANNLDNLPKWEIGSGDPITGTKGRIMWFPPYDLNFSESVSVGLDGTNFIGRGEPIFTYNNTERSGTLSFKVIMDHPNYLNDKGFQSTYNEFFDDMVNSIVSGCGDIPETLNAFLTKEERDEIELEAAVQEQKKVLKPQTPPEPFNIYFPNDVTKLSGGNDNSYELYEVLGSENEPYTTPWQKTQTGGYTPGLTTQTNGFYEDRKNYGLNKKWRNPEFISKLKNDLRELCPSCRVKISGFASIHGQAESNKKLSVDRASEIANWFRQNVINDEDPRIAEKRFSSGEQNGIGKGVTGNKDLNQAVDHIDKKKARFVTISFEPDPTIDEINKENVKKKVDKLKDKVLTNRIRSRFFNESEHFKKLKLEDPIVYNSLKDKIKFFHPSFHSITPEGFNSRLTFLHQCTRQGATLNKDGRPDNMSFGMAPVCILRLGDFYHTKIMIDSMSIEYDNTWDLNPEGVGVQPMIATIGLSFKFLGGHSMEGPINRLQNAVAFNFFANTEIYDPRADKIVLDENGGKYVNGIKKLDELLDDIGKDNDKEGVTSNLPQSETNQEKLSELEDLNTISGESLPDNSSNETLSVVGIDRVGLTDVFVQESGIRLVGFDCFVKFSSSIDTLDKANNILSNILPNNLKFSLLSPTNKVIQEFIYKPENDANITANYILTNKVNFKFGNLTINNNVGFDFNKENLSPGNYIINLSYNGKRLASTSINVKKEN